ncbi:MAG: hypothetical protein AUJ52_01355 [Elusimicrobia bacterium CG1_02_63_36]|nr:MAG: hypothetical protein AUJ52_01355 [Elusimicrobia bacterium CG1_02_63_36]PIP84237.1 MAG: hypothetical protein COR54_05410 [Elusimicrobia bacterium CG22_combo_CG10-13_8_21_14_all_63_91]PJA17132.1 MAG: hypothetical protein COX66_05580 [Elusimicrobia bacterium CG_4_10_14_0_2_um_filter_63_34]PJB25520.1 MAG: hypothetical protein CO113_08205 [Elusimicrobia bacterium CG_4_9_14_3_um_filter_62_55]
MKPLFVLLALMAAGTVPARAQIPWVPSFDRPRWGFGLALGPVFPGGSAGFSETSSRGFGYDLGVQRFITPSWSLGLDIHKSQFNGKAALPAMPADGSFRVAGASFQTFFLTTRINLVSKETWAPYLGAGIGYADGKSNILTGAAGGNRLDAVATRGAAISARAGFESYLYHGLTWFAEARWLQYRLDAQSGGPGIPAAGLSAVHLRFGLRLWLDVKDD